MGAFDLIRELRGAGVIVRVDGEELDVSPAERLTDESIKALKRHKREILALLKNEESRQKAIGLMNASPDTPRGIYVDDQIDPENIVLFVAVRLCMETCELLIPRAKYDPFALLALVERLGKATHQ